MDALGGVPSLVREVGATKASFLSLTAVGYSFRVGIRACHRPRSGSLQRALGDPPLAIDHVSYDRIPVVNPLANLIRRIALMYEGDDRGDSHYWHQHEAD